jgi:hypothetical protein
VKLTRLASAGFVLLPSSGTGKSEYASQLREWHLLCFDAYLEDLDDLLIAVLMGTGDRQMRSPRLASPLLDVLLLVLIAASDVTPEEPTERAAATRVKARPRRTRRRRTRSHHVRSRRVTPSAARPRTRLFCPVRRRKPAQFVSSACVASPAMAAMALFLPDGRRRLAGSPCLPAVTESHWGAASS